MPVENDAHPPLERPTGAPPLYAQDGRGYEAVVHAHYFLGGSDWLVTEYSATHDEAFGWACLNGDRQNAELGYTSMTELDTVRAPMRVQLPDDTVVVVGYARVELDAHWPAGQTLAQGVAELDRRQGR